MSYKACFECELVFEVDAATATCPECARPLEDYEPEQDELVEDSLSDGFDDAPPTQALAAVSGSLRPTATLDAAAVAVARAGLVSSGEAGQDKTRMLQIPDGLAAVGVGRNPALESTEALKIDEVVRPLPPLVSRKPKDRRSVFGQTGPDAGDAAPRHTRVVSADGAAPPARRARPESAPAATPSPRGPRTPRPTASRPAAAEEMGRPTVSVMPRRSGPSIGLLAGAGAGLLALVGGLYFAFSGGETPAPAEQDAAIVAPKLDWSATLAKQLEGAESYLPVLGDVPRVQDGAYIAGGPEGFASSFGNIVGLPSTKIADGVIDHDRDGEWVRPLRAALERSTAGRDAPLGLAFDAKMPARDFLRLAVAAERAGRNRLLLLVGREAGQGEIGGIPFGAWRASSRLPPEGVVIARIGQLGFHVTVKDGSGQVISLGPNMIVRRRKALDYDALGKRLRALRDAHPGVEMIIVYPNPETPLEQLATVLATAAFRGDGQPRFTDVRVASR